MTSKESTNPSTASGTATTAATTAPVFGIAAAAMNPAFDIDVWQSGGGGKGEPLLYEQSCYELYWNDLPSLEVTKPKILTSDPTRDEKKTMDEPTTNANEETKKKSKTVLTVDGYSFEGRMATYKYIIEHSMCNIAVPTCTSKEDPSKEGRKVWGDRLERHFFWGYAALLDWEYRSGRLAYAGTLKGGSDDKTSIANDSWWGYMNFCYSICVLLGAHEAGVLDPSIERIQLSDEFSNHLVRTDPIVRKTIKEWSVFWKQAVTPFVKQTLELAETKLPLDDPRHERLYDAMNEHEWKVHSYVFQWAVFDKSTDDESLPQRLLRELPEPERKFCVGFCKAVDLFAALNWRTDLTITLENGPSFMPLQVLDERTTHHFSQTGASCSKAEKYRRKTVTEMHNLCDTSDEVIQTMASVWKRVGRWHSVRRNMGSMIKGLSHGSVVVKTKELCRLAVYLILPANAWEASLWLGVAAASTAGLFLTKGSHRTKS